MEGWTVVYSDSFPLAVELRRSVLDQLKIPAVVLNKRDSSYLFGLVELLVQDQDRDRALEALSQKESSSFET
tara:strand:- start:5613 stop:5828 length:216 start_codon:yes stop_codon:yes gene_type:complete